MVAKKSCGHAIFQPLCTNALFALCGFNNKQFNATLLPIVMGHTPAGSSLRQVLHYAQLVNSGRLSISFKDDRIYIYVLNFY